LAILGCGAQAGPQLEALRAVLPITDVRCWDAVAARAERFADIARRDGVNAWAAVDLAGAVRGADVVVTCTTARQPFLDVDHAEPGQFIAAVGADSPEKNEIAPALMARARVVVDVLDQCVVMGDLHHAIGAQAMNLTEVHGELAEIVTGAKPARTLANEIFIFDSTGVGVQDVASAAWILERAVAKGAEKRVRLGQ
jgi:alanine dehydrogenase